VKVVVLHTAEALEPPADPVLEQIRIALTSAGHSASLLGVASDVEPVVAGLRAASPDLVFNLAESFGGKSALESNVAALLNLLGLRYTGSSPAGLLLAGDKSLTKKILRVHDIRSPKFTTLYRGALDLAGDIAFPVIVKPPQEDASIGITSSSVVRDIKELFGKMDALQSEFQGPVLLEEFVDGREFYVGVLGNVQPEALPVIELDFSAMPAGMPRIASWDAKWGTDGQGAGEEFAGTKSVFPEGIAADLVERMQHVAVECFQALRLRDYARIDLRVTEGGDVYVIEVNPNPYLERESEFARAADRAGHTYDALIARIVELAAARYSR
jgi:D-alanine-D-alanine ligase